MSRGIKWQVDFVSLKGKNYSVKILAEDYTGDVIHLQGAPEPFTTSEDNSEDYFLPVRTQTGYLRIIDTGKDLDGNAFNWADMLPDKNTQNQVQLLNGSTLVWVGYMKADLLTTQAFDYGTVVEFPVICPLSLLSSLPITFTNEGGTMLTFGQLLHRALSATGIVFDYLWIAADFPNAVDLNARVSLMNYADVNPTITGNILVNLATWKEKDAWIKVINSICQFWGWTLYLRGRTLYITCSGETNEYRLFPFASLNQTIPGLEFRAYTATPVSIDTLNFMSTDHYKEVLLGRRSVNIEAKVNKWENIMSPKLENLTYEWYGGENHVVVYKNDKSEPTENSIQFFLKNTTVHEEALQNYLLRFNPVYIGNRTNILLSKDDTWPYDSEKNEFSLTTNIQCLTGGNGSGYNLFQQSVFVIQTAYTVPAPSGSMISISGNGRKDFNKNTLSDDSYLRMMISIGDKFYSPDTKTWVNEYTECHVYFTKSGKIKTTKELFDPHYGATGYCMQVPDSLYGKLTLYFLMNPSTDILLRDLVIKIVPTDDMVFPTAEAERTYKKEANNTFAEDETIELDLMSGDNNKYGKGQVFDEYGDYLTELPFIGTNAGTMLPEEHLLKRMASVYSRTRERLQIEVEENADNARPFNRFKRHDGRDIEYSVQCVNHNYSEDSMELTIVEL